MCSGPVRTHYWKYILREYAIVNVAVLHLQPLAYRLLQWSVGGLNSNPNLLSLVSL